MLRERYARHGRGPTPRPHRACPRPSGCSADAAPRHTRPSTRSCGAPAGSCGGGVRSPCRAYKSRRAAGGPYSRPNSRAPTRSPFSHQCPYEASPPRFKLRRMRAAAFVLERARSLPTDWMDGNALPWLGPWSRCRAPRSHHARSRISVASVIALRHRGAVLLVEQTLLAGAVEQRLDARWRPGAHPRWRTRRARCRPGWCRTARVPGSPRRPGAGCSGSPPDAGLCDRPCGSRAGRGRRAFRQREAVRSSRRSRRAARRHQAAGS